MEQPVDKAINTPGGLNIMPEPGPIEKYAAFLVKHALIIFIVLSILATGAALELKLSNQTLCQTACLQWTHSSGFYSGPTGACYCYNQNTNCTLPASNFTNQFNNLTGGMAE